MGGDRAGDLMIGAVAVLPDDPPHLARLKRRVLSGSRPTRQSDLKAIHTLAIAMFIWQRTPMLEALVQRLRTIQFQGDFNLWSWIERCRALDAYLQYNRGDTKALDYVRGEIRAAGYVEGRRRGLLSHSARGYRANYLAALAKDDRRSLLGWGVPYVSELVFIWVMGGSLKLPRRSVEEELSQAVAQIRERPPPR